MSTPRFRITRLLWLLPALAAVLLAACTAVSPPAAGSLPLRAHKVRKECRECQVHRALPVPKGQQACRPRGSSRGSLRRQAWDFRQRSRQSSSPTRASRSSR